MAYIYAKKGRWFGRIKLGPGHWHAVALRLAAGGNVRLARERVHTLQAEVQAQLVGQATQAWLGNHRAAALLAEARRAGRPSVAGLSTWAEAARAWLVATTERDAVRPTPGKVNPIARTRATRERTVRRFLDWVGEQPLAGQSFTVLLHDYLVENIASRGWASATANQHYSYLVVFGDWLASKRVIEAPDRDTIKEVLPPGDPPLVVLPEAAADVALTAGLQAAWAAGSVYASAWPLWLLARGLGCRPSEAISLSWDTVDLDVGVVRFLDTKEGKSYRTAPILLEWVRSGLAELASARRSGVSVPVCTNSKGRHWSNEGNSGRLVRKAQIALSLPRVNPKKSQKMYIYQLIRLGFPPHAVASWTGHTLTIQERHYCEETVYLPLRDETLGEFDTLSDFGSRARRHNTPG